MRNPDKFENSKHFWVVLKNFKEIKTMKDKFEMLYFIRTPNKFLCVKYFWVVVMSFKDIK